MMVIRPAKITASKVLSTNAINLYSDWISTTTYGVGDRVTYNNYYWESLISSNTGNIPELEPTKWVQLQASNKWAMFDSQVSSATTFNGNLQVVIKPNEYFTSIALFNVSALNCSISITNGIGGETIFESSKVLDKTFISNWYSYFFEEFDIGDELVFDGVPPYKNAVITVTLYGMSKTSVGVIVIGQKIEIGKTRNGLNYGIRDYSVKETDEFGITRFVERNFSKRMSPAVFVENGQLNFVGKVLTGLRATPSAWIATEDSRFQGTTIFGYVKDWNVEISYPQHSLISIEIEGLT